MLRDWSIPGIMLDAGRQTVVIMKMLSSLMMMVGVLVKAYTMSYFLYKCVCHMYMSCFLYKWTLLNFGQFCEGGIIIILSFHMRELRKEG